MQAVYWYAVLLLQPTLYLVSAPGPLHGPGRGELGGEEGTSLPGNEQTHGRYRRPAASPAPSSRGRAEAGAGRRGARPGALGGARGGQTCNFSSAGQGRAAGREQARGLLPGAPSRAGSLSGRVPLCHLPGRVPRYLRGHWSAAAGAPARAVGCGLQATSCPPLPPEGGSTFGRGDPRPPGCHYGRPRHGRAGTQ